MRPLRGPGMTRIYSNRPDPDDLRSKILRDQTSCRCGHLLAACADCRGWLGEHSPRIEGSWRWFINTYCWTPAYITRWDVRAADLAEEHDLGVYLARRFLNG